MFSYSTVLIKLPEIIKNLDWTGQMGIYNITAY